jgi:hypothetical protein
MGRPGRQRGQIMLIFLGTLFLGSGVVTGVFTSGKSIKSIRQEARAMHLESDRRERVLTILDAWEEMAEPAGQSYVKFGKELVDLVRKQSTTQAEFQTLLDQERAELQHNQDMLLPLRDELRATLSEDEWNRLLK